MKREQGDFSEEAVKLAAAKIPRQSIDEMSMLRSSESNAMSVLPRLLRNMGNKVNMDANGISNSVSVDGLQVAVANEGSNTAIVPGVLLNDTDSSSSASSFVSTPSSSSSLISFLSPKQLGPVAAMAAVALSTAVTTISVNEISESSGLDTLATASSLFEKEWLARAALANNGCSNNSVINTDSELSMRTADVLTSNIDQQRSINASPPVLLKTLTTPSSQVAVNGSVPTNRTVLDVQSLAAFIRERQKQCSITTASTTPLELPLTSVFTLPTETKLTTTCSARQVASPSYLVPTSTPAVFSVAPAPQQASPTIDQRLNTDTIQLDPNPTNSPAPPAAFISLQPAPGSVLSTSDLQQLMSSGEFMSSAARTLLGQSPDGSTRQLYLLVPSDCSMIMPRAQPTIQTTTLTSGLPPSTTPPAESISSSAPILEAISPGVEPDESCTQLNTESQTCGLQSSSNSMPNLASAVLTPMSSTALSTLLAGLDARNQPQSSRICGIPLGSNAPRISCPFSISSVQTTDSLAPSCPKVRLPLHLSGLSIPENGLLPNDQAVYPASSNDNSNASLLGAVKTDPDMYTPNGHSYTSLGEDPGRFRNYSSYPQPVSHQLSLGSLRTPSTSNGSFFRSEPSPSVMLQQPCSIATTVNGNTPANEDAITNGHFQVSSAARSNSAASSNFAISFSTTPAASSPLLTSTSKPNTSGDECRRSGVMNATSNGRSEQGPTTYLEHLNPESKDIRRRVSHNEVERRRRDRINTWIGELHKLLPPDEQTKSQYQSKGIVLKRVCEYFQNVDGMLKAANAAVEKTAMENNYLRQKVQALERDKQILSAYSQLGAAAAAAQLTRQPRPGNSTNLDESNGTASSNNNGGTNNTNGNNNNTNGNGNNNGNNCVHLKDSIDIPDYQTSVAVFTVGAGSNYGQLPNFSQPNPACVLPTNACTSTAFPTSLASINTVGVFTTHNNLADSSKLISSTSDMLNPLALPSLDQVTNHGGVGDGSNA